LLAWLQKNKKPAQGLLGLELSPDGIALAHVLRAPGKPAQLLRCAFRAALPAAQAAELKSMVAEFALAGTPVNLLLHPSQYQLLLLECPDVPAEELRDAMRWKIKEQISEPIEQVLVDAFALPADAYRGRSRMAYCVVLAKSRVEAWVSLLKQAGLELHSIDITEMAFRNLGLQVGAEGVNLALLRLRSSEGLIAVQQGAELYMARRIEQGLDQASQDFTGLTLEIQRSLDYFESQLGKGYINRLLLIPMKREGTQALKVLSEGLAVNLQALSLPDLFAGQAAAEVDERQQAYCFAAVGAALRQEA
jgi:MSHA biogenesis protein MshI